MIKIGLHSFVYVSVPKCVRCTLSLLLSCKQTGGAALALAVSVDLPVSAAMWEWSCQRETHLASLKQHIIYLIYTSAKMGKNVVRILQTIDINVILKVVF